MCGGPKIRAIHYFFGGFPILRIIVWLGFYLGSYLEKLLEAGLSKICCGQTCCANFEPENVRGLIVIGTRKGSMMLTMSQRPNDPLCRSPIYPSGSHPLPLLRNSLASQSCDHLLGAQYNAALTLFKVSRHEP